MNGIRYLLVVFVLVVLPGPSRAEVRRSWPTMGTLAEVTLDTNPSQRADRAVASVRKVFERVNRTMTVYDEDSDLNSVNRWAGFRSVGVDPWVAEVVGHARRAQFVTGGAFSAVRLAEGIQRGLKPPLVNVTPGDYASESIDVRRVPPGIFLHRPGMGLDLGGIAKGYALDRAGDVLERQGFNRYVLNLGRSLKLGDPPRGETGWTVKLAGRPEVRRLANTVISTSRQGVRSDTDHVIVGGERRDTTVRRRVAVAARSGWVSDMASTALLADPTLIRRLMEQYPNLLWVDIGRLDPTAD